MDFFEAVDSRYSYRGTFETTPLPQAHIDRILTAAIAAPTGMGVQTGSYVAVTDPEKLAALGKIMSRYGTAPFVMVMLTEDKGTAINFEIENYSAAAQNALLAVTALGYATVWTDGVLRSADMNNAIREVLSIPAEKTIRAVLPIGIPTEPLAPKAKCALADVVSYL